MNIKLCVRLALPLRGKNTSCYTISYQNLQEKYPFVNEEERSVYNEVTKFLGFK